VLKALPYFIALVVRNFLRERARLFAGFDSGRIVVLTSVNVLAEVGDTWEKTVVVGVSALVWGLQGFDQPDIGAVMLLRPTQSKVPTVSMSPSCGTTDAGVLW
jgi:hypothetical protein